MNPYRVGEGPAPRKNIFMEQLSTRWLSFLRWFRRTEIRLSRRRDYARWQARNEPDDDALTRQRSLAVGLETPLTLLVHMVVSERDMEWMVHTLDHLRSQTYPWWQLRIYSQAESINHIQAVLQAEKAHDSRTSTLPLGRNSIEKSHEGPDETADIQVALRPGDCLAPSALWDIAKFFDNCPEIGMVYTDEDRLDLRGRRHRPWFKPDWSPELLYSVNYLQPLFIRRKILEEDPENGLWCNGEIELTSLWESCIRGSHRVGHLPKILLHRMVHQEGGYVDNRAEQEIHANWVEGMFRKLGKKTLQVTHPTSHGLRVSWATDNPLVSIIIPTKDNHQILDRCLRSLMKKTAYPKYELLILDSGKPETTHDLSAHYSSAEIPMRVFPVKSPFNYSRTNNEGARAAAGELFLFLNDDVEIIEGDWLEELVRWTKLQEIGVVGAKLLYPNKAVQHLGVIVGMSGHANHVFNGAEEDDDGPFGPPEWYRNFLAVTGACMMIRKEVFESAGGFNEDYQLAFSDIELCLRMVEKGLRVMVTPHARLVHREGSTRGRYMPVEDLILARDAFLPWIKSGDPYFNPNLSYASPYPRLAVKREDREGRLRTILERVAPIKTQE
jgi:GT2 family glycosyltransferase